MRPPLTAGLGAGLATGAWMFAEYALGLHDDPAGAGRWTGFFALIFPVAGASWMVRQAPGAGWGRTMLAGLVFGASGGLVNGAAILLYFAVVNPAFRLAGQPVDAAAQATAGFMGSLILGLILAPICQLLLRPKGKSHVR